MINKPSFPEAMVAACKAALAQNVFYQDEFKDFVLKYMGGFDCPGVLVETVSINWDSEGGVASEREAAERLVNVMKALPRGHYALIHKYGVNQYCSYRTIVSAGDGEIALGGSHDHYDHPCSPENVLDRMFGYEIYCCRNEIEKQMRRDEDVKALVSNQASIGMAYKDFTYPGEVKNFSNAVISKIDSDHGLIHLVMSRKGTSRKWNGCIGAKAFFERVGGLSLPEIKPQCFMMEGLLI